MIANEIFQVKDYKTRIEKSIDGTEYYVLSFSSYKHLKVSRLAHEIIDCFRKPVDIYEVKEKLHAKSIYLPDKEILEFIDEILIQNKILKGIESNKTDGLNSRMWIRIPLFRSNKLKPLTKLLSFFINKGVAITVTLTYTIILLLMFFNVYKHSMFELQMSNQMVVLLTSYLSIFFHEIGHIAASHKYKIDSGDFGIGFYLFFPVAFVDLTDAWSVDYKKRMVVDIAGMYFQIIYSIIIFIIYLITGKYSLLLSVQTIFMLTVMNLIPTLKLDGYWFMSDYLRVSNISIKPLHKILEVIKKSRSGNSVNKEDTVYLIYSTLYIFSVSLILISAGFYIIDLVKNSHLITDLFKSIIESFRIMNIKAGLRHLLNFFMKLAPLIIMVYMILKSILKPIVILAGNLKKKIYKDK